MNERDFDNFDDIFNKKLNEVPNFPNEDKNWEKISARVDALSNGNATLHGLWWWLPIGLLLMGWNGWQTWTIRQMQQDNRDLKSVVQGYKSGVIYQADTVFVTHTVIKTDTIFHNIHLIPKATSGIEPSDKNTPKAEANGFYSGSKSVNSPPDDNTDDIKGNQSSYLSPADWHNTITSDNRSRTQSDKITPVPSKYETYDKTTVQNKSWLSDTPPSVSSVENQNSKPQLTQEDIKKDTSIMLTNIPEKNKAAQETTEKLPATADAMKNDTTVIQQHSNIKIALDSFEKKLTSSNETHPSQTVIIQKSPIKIVKGVSLGVFSGLSDLLPHQPNINLGQWWGMSADFSLHPRFSIATDISQLNTHYKVFEYPKNIEPLNLPRQPISNQDYALKYIEGHIKSWQLGISAQYTLLPQKRIKPFLTTGYMYRIVVPSEVEFEYLNITTQDEKSFKTKNSGNHFDNWWRAGVGIEGNIYKKIGAKISANYMLDFDKKDNTHLKYWALNVGISYKIR